MKFKTKEMKKCELCFHDKFEFIQEQREYMCLNCGMMREMEELNYVQTEFIQKGKMGGIHEKKDTTKTDFILEDYLTILKETWSFDDLKAVETEMRNVKSEEIPLRSLLLTVILKYAFKKNIPCDLRIHRERMRINSLGKAFAFIKAGV